MSFLKNIDKVIFEPKNLKPLLKIYEDKGKAYYYNELFDKANEKVVSYNTTANILEAFKFFDIENEVSQSRKGVISKKDLRVTKKMEIRLDNVKKIILNTDNQIEPILFQGDVIDYMNVLSYRYQENKFRGIKDLPKVLGKDITRSEFVLSDIFTMYERMKRTENYEVVLLTCLLIADIYNFKLFEKDNFEIALLALYNLLRGEFIAFRYVPFFKYINDKKEELIGALKASEYGFIQGFPQINLLYDLILEILKKAYYDLGLLAHKYEFEKTLNKTSNIEGAILDGPDIFTKEDLRHRHPNVSESTLNRTISKLRDQNKIRMVGSGRAAYWQKVTKIDDFQQSFFTDTEFGNDNKDSKQ